MSNDAQPWLVMFGDKIATTITEAERDAVAYGIYPADTPGAGTVTVPRKVQVTRADILSGKRYSPGSCPIAQAMLRDTSGDWVRVNERHALYGGRATGTRKVRFTRGVREWIHHFDEREPVEPFTLVVDSDPARGNLWWAERGRIGRGVL